MVAGGIVMIVGPIYENRYLAWWQNTLKESKKQAFGPRARWATGLAEFGSVASDIRTDLL